MHAVSHPITPSNSSTAARVGGWSFILAAVGFMTVFSYLAATFQYPSVLDGSASEVLPKLLALGTGGRAVWALYAMLPLLLIPAAIGAQSAFGEHAPNVMRLAVVAGVISAISMFLGLARWPSVHWELARAYADVSPQAQQSIDAIFRGLNVYLGNYVGEFLGEIALNMFFMCTAFAMRRTHPLLGKLGMFVGLIGLIAALRNATSAVVLIAEMNNYVLPIWLIVLGVVLARIRRA